MCRSRLVFTQVLLVIAVFSATSFDVSAAELRAAAAKTDITPSDSVELWGYSDRSGPATGTHDPLFAKVLLFDDATTRLALVSLDLGRTFGVDSMNLVRNRVRKSAGVTEVCFCASHTHSAPVIEDSYPDGKRPAWETVALDRISAAIESAAAKLEPVSMGTGEGLVLIGHNRRLLQPDGKIKMFWRNATKIPTHPVDPQVGVIRIDSPSGKTLAVVVNYACHPVVYGPDNLQYSADFPSATAEVVEGGMGPDCVCLFVQGAPGDINPYFDKMRLDEGAEKLMQETGHTLGQEALRVAKVIVPMVPKTPEVQVSIETRRFKPRYDTEKLLEKLRSTVKPEAFERYRKYLTAPMDCPVTTILLNREIAMMGMPGEPFVDLGINFRDRAPASQAFFAGYMNGYFAYFPTIRAAVEGGYGAEGIVARVEVGAGEAMVDMAIVQLLKMQRLLKPVP
jgi:neutral ceramidase